MALSFHESVWLATVPLAGVIGGYLASFAVANRNVYINSITKERSQWIEKLRLNLAEFSTELEQYSLYIHLMYGPDKVEDPYALISKSELMAQKKRVEHAALILQLQLNPRGVIDGNISILVACGVGARGKPVDLLTKLQKLIVEHSQWLLKAEWEKVKREARSAIWRLGHLGDEARYLNAYQRWAFNAGRYEQLLDDLKNSESIV